MQVEDDLRKTLTARSSKSPLIVLAENTQGPANLILLPPKEKLDVICPDEIYQLVGECKYINIKINKIELGFDSTGRLSDPDK